MDTEWNYGSNERVVFGTWEIRGAPRLVYRYEVLTSDLIYRTSYDTNEMLALRQRETLTSRPSVYRCEVIMTVIPSAPSYCTGYNTNEEVAF